MAHNIPTYVKRMLKRASFAIETPHYVKGDDPSYTIIIPKHSIYAQVDTLKAEVAKLAAWAMRRVYGIRPSVSDMKFPPVVICSLPSETHYCRQYAKVVIYDPVMVRVEHLIGASAISLN